jgi:hypothetical protein
MGATHTYQHTDMTSTLPWLAPGLLKEGETGANYQKPMSSAPGDGTGNNAILDHMGAREVLKPQQGNQRYARRVYYTLVFRRRNQPNAPAASTSPKSTRRRTRATSST